MNTEFISGTGSRSLNLVKAILLYSSVNDDFLATVHDIETGQLLPGTPIDRDDLSTVVAKLSGQAQAGRSILPVRVLYSDAALLMWWCPASRRPIYFKSGKSELDSLSGQEVAHPPLVFLARSQSLFVWALQENERPVASTKLYVAPYFNIYEGGGMCSGNVRLPESLTPTEANLEAWGEAFFGTNFTHSNLGGGKLTAFPGGHNALWEKMALECEQSKHWQFPCEAALVPTKLTVEAALAKGGSR
jgi:PRTRC genetic system protein B